MNRMLPFPLLLQTLVLMTAIPLADANDGASYFGIRVVDEQTGRGVPLAKLTTTNSIELWTDSQGWIAFCEPGLMNTEVHFSLESPGYEMAADGFGYRGIRVETTVGKTTQVALKRINRAERLYRITGQGIYRDSQLLDLDYPKEIPQLNSGVTGQDSVQMVAYRGKLFWLWGDTNLARYPLGNFHTTVATSPLPGTLGNGNTDPRRAIPLNYLAENEISVRRAMPTDQPGAVWLFGLINVPDDQGNECLVAHYSRHLKLGKMVEQGIAAWDDRRQQFVKQVEFELDNEWRIPRGQAVRLSNADGDWIYFADSFAMTRVPASKAAMLRPESYQALSWTEETGMYEWQNSLAPTSQKDENLLVNAGSMPVQSAIYKLVDVETGRSIRMHRSSINWNEYRRCWIMIGCQAGDMTTPSLLGEIWYAEAPSVSGPWQRAIKVATHPRYTFYNPRQHALFDEEGGRYIYFEGTYTHQFSGNSKQTPRYDYNQIMYRLDLKGLLPDDKP